MKDEKKVRRLRFYILSGVALLIAIVSYSFGGLGKVPKSQVKSQVSTAKKIDLTKAKINEVEITQKDVKKFLVAYYTKKDLEENRNRYKPFMTDSMYKTALSAEETPVAQTYKGYVINQKFQDAKVYIDATNQTVLVKVDYSYVTLTKKTDKASDGMSNNSTATLLLTYQKSGKSLLVNNIQNVSFDDRSSDTSEGIKGQEAIYEQSESKTTTSDEKLPTAEERLGTTTASVEKPKTDEENK